MRCSKCGEECREGLNFCLRCGTPIQEIPDKEEIEEELKENVEGLIGDVKEVRVPFQDLIDKIDIDDDDDMDYDYDEDDEELDLAIGRDLSKISNGKKKTDDSTVRILDDDEDDDEKKGFFKNKKNVVIVSIIAVVIIAAIIFLAVSIFSNNKSYSEYYSKGEQYYAAGNYKAAASQFEKAAKAASTDTEKTNAYEMLWSAYSQLNGYEEEQIEALEQLIALNPDEITYYEALLTLYQDTDQTDKTEELLASVTDESLKEQLSRFDTTVPVATEEEGTYSTAITVGLSASKNRDIYYTTDGSTPTTSSTEYDGAIEFTKEGTYVLKAISAGDDGTVSGVLTATYVIDFGNVSAPEVNLDSGTYSTQKKIKVTVDGDATIYYTTDGTTPTESSKEYTKAFYMEEGNNVYSFIAVDSSGAKSDVVTRVYILKPDYTYSYDSATSKLASTLVSWGIMENQYGEYSDGSVMYFAYKTTTLIDRNYYYIIAASKESSDGSVISEKTYAVGCDSGDIYTASYGSDGYEISGLDD